MEKFLIDAEAPARMNVYKNVKYLTPYQSNTHFLY